MEITYDQLKEYHLDDSLTKMLNPDQLKKLGKAVDDWYCGTTFDELERITGINPIDYPEAIDIEDSSKETDRDEAIDLARAEWDKQTVEQKLNDFVEICDNGEELLKHLSDVSV